MLLSEVFLTLLAPNPINAASPSVIAEPTIPETLVPAVFSASDLNA